MLKKIVVDAQIKEHNGKHLVCIDKLVQVTPNEAIEILTLKYSNKGIFNRICKGLNILAEDLDRLLKLENGSGKRKEK